MAGTSKACVSMAEQIRLINECYSRYDQRLEERQELLPLPAVPYEYITSRNLNE